MLFGLSLNVTPEEARTFWKVLKAMRENKVTTVGFQIGHESLFFNLDTYDFSCEVNEQNKQIGDDTVIESMYAVQIKGTMKESS